MGTRSMLLAVLAVGCAVLLLHPGPAVGEDETASAPGLWVFDVRVVRVDTATLETTETAGAWEPGGDGTTTRPWAEVLKALKARGTTLVLLDQRVTTAPGGEALARQVKYAQIKQYQNSDYNNERHQAFPLQSGSTVKLRPAAAPGTALQYDVEVNWWLPAREGDLRPITGTAGWSGTHKGLFDTTLVLPYREQVEFLDGERQGVEIYVLLTGHHVP